MRSSEAGVARLWNPAPLAPARGSAEAELEARRRRAVEEGYQTGYRAGQAAVKATSQRLEEMLASVGGSIELIEERLAGELLDFALELARHVVRAELKANREAIMPVAQEALAALSEEARGLQLLAHPTDADLLRTHLADEIARGGWRIVEDHRIQAGGLRVLSTAGDVDATLGTRWRRALAALGRDEEWHDD